jgi:hypothetical protein
VRSEVRVESGEVESGEWVACCEGVCTPLYALIAVVQAGSCYRQCDRDCICCRRRVGLFVVVDAGAAAVNLVEVVGYFLW